MESYMTEEVLPSNKSLPKSQQQTFSSSVNNNQHVSPVIMELDGTMLDSALVSALRDPRERLILFKLEQAMVEFLSKSFQADEPQVYDYIDVGGQGFSIILKSTDNINSTTLNTLLIARTADPNASVFRQSSFQRLMLHRLADRFNIVREMSPLSTPNVPLIRLLRVPSSSIPTQLLIDLDLSSLLTKTSSNNVLSTIPQDRGGQDVVVEHDDTHCDFHSQPATIILAPNTTGGESDPNESSISRTMNPKVMIMKRSTSSIRTCKKNDSDNNLTSLDGNEMNHRNRRSNKEKAYAEARARIFNKEINNESVDSEPSSLADTDSNNLDKLQSGSFSDLSLLQALEATIQSPSASGTTTPQSPPTGDLLSGTPTPMSSYYPTESDTNNNNNNNNSTMMDPTGSKVLWRNRRQEETDPDFRRGIVSVAAPTTTTSSNMYPIPISYLVPSNSMRVGPTVRTNLPIPTPVTHYPHHIPTMMYPHSYNVPQHYQGPNVPYGFIHSVPHAPSYGNRPWNSSIPDSSPQRAVYEANSHVATDLFVPSFDTHREDLTNNQGKVFLNRRSESSPWGIGRGKVMVSPSEQGKEGLSEKDFPALG